MRYIDRDHIELFGTLVVEPFADFGMVRMRESSARIQQLIEPGDTAAVFWRAVARPVDEPDSGWRDRRPAHR